jgi:hypothetical protein
MYNFFTSSELSLAELVCELPFTPLSNYVNSINPSATGTLQVSDVEYDLETNNIQVDDADFYEYIPAVVDGSDEDEVATLDLPVLDDNKKLSPLAQEPLAIQQHPLSEPIGSVSIVEVETDDFTVIKKGKKGMR